MALPLAKNPTVTWGAVVMRRMFSFICLWHTSCDTRRLISEACGGPNRLSVYTSTGNVTALPVPTPQNTSLPDGWSYQGCLQ